MMSSNNFPHLSKIQNEIFNIRIWIISCLAILPKINERKEKLIT